MSRHRISPIAPLHLGPIRPRDPSRVYHLRRDRRVALLWFGCVLSPLADRAMTVLVHGPP